MSRPTPTLSRIIFALCLLVLTFLSLRPLGFTYHYFSFLIHQRAGREEQSGISLFRAAHFNPAPVLRNGSNPKRIMDAVLVRAVLRQDPGEIEKHVSSLFPLEKFQRYYGGNPWFQGLTADPGHAPDWLNLDRAGHRLLADPRANPVLWRRLDQPGGTPERKAAEWLALWARLRGNPALASRLDPGDAAARLSAAIHAGPAPGLIPRGPVFAAVFRLNKTSASHWRLFSHSRGEPYKNTPGYAVETENGLMLAVPPGCSRETVGAVLRERIQLLPGTWRLRVVYLADIEDGRLILRADGKTQHELGDTAGEWQSADLELAPETGTMNFLLPRLVLSGKGLAVVAGIWLTGRENPEN